MSCLAAVGLPKFLDRQVSAIAFANGVPAGLEFC
jgi:hypothetical protein